MTKVIHRKPGPKSAKQSKILAKRGTLGETSAESDSDDSSPEQTIDNNSNQASGTPETENTLRSQRGANNVSEFRTPDAENDVTDYGLEFTTSNIQNPSPRRCSTLRTAASSQEESGGGVEKANKTNKENSTPLSTLTKSPQKSTMPPKKLTKQRKTKTKSTETPLTKEIPIPKETTLSANETPAAEDKKQVVRKPRKHRNPLQLEKRFWKDVQVLQNRTDNLIPMLPFSRLVRELMHDASSEVTKITPTAMEALQTSSELYLTQRLQDAYMLTLHRGRVTLDVKDMELINYLKINL
ncbi:histone H3-like centromeric protein cid [Calliphora vicina]|uniref:histone H3-like centromeric protein cid n=1 Tax=Calliphora vicina TaxID=7373 RepID=UPI00325B1EA5